MKETSSCFSLQKVKEDRTVMMIESVGRASYSNCSTVWRCGIDGGKDDIQISIATITANLHS